MKAVSIYFPSNTIDYGRLLRVLQNSWVKNSDLPLETSVVWFRHRGDRYFHYANNHKLKKWRDNLHDDTIFLDCDMLCLRDPVTGFEGVTDIGYTVQPNSKAVPYNAGVLFVRDTAYSWAFLEKWIEVDTLMLSDLELHAEYNAICAGQNQASFAWMLHNGWEATPVPQSYNLCEPWSNWEDAHLIHVKDFLRRAVLHENGQIDVKYIEPIVREWQKYEGRYRRIRKQV